MRAVLFFAAAALVALCSSFAHAAPLQVFLDTWPRYPNPGERTFFLSRLSNYSGESVRTPATFVEDLIPKARFNAPGQTPKGAPETHRAGRHKYSSLKRLTLGPDESIEHLGELAKIVPDCKDGCPEGEIALTVQMVPYEMEGWEPNYITEDDHPAKQTVWVRPMSGHPKHHLSRQGRDVIETSVIGSHSSAHGMVMRIRWKNISKHPTWIVRPASWSINNICTIFVGGGGSCSTRGGHRGDPEPMTARDYVLLNPGKSFEGDQFIGNLFHARSVTFSLLGLVPRKDLVQLDPPFVWGGVHDLKYDFIPRRKRQTP